MIRPERHRDIIFVEVGLFGVVSPTHEDFDMSTIPRRPEQGSAPGTVWYTCEFGENGSIRYIKHVVPPNEEVKDSEAK